ncbi:MAG: CYTH domain-containing protein [Pseudomonadales bacterium]|jgi:CYTH domain-containing protein|nr:CYTH domain-containing protein [Pseudomonadales bacterium]
MAIEIERKFLITDAGVLAGREGVSIEQGYLPVEDPMSVRIRILETAGDARALLTMKKGQSARRRLEFEYAIPVADARVLLEEACGAARIRKTRYRITWAGRDWDLDRFEDANAPLCLAEVELDAEDDRVTLPPWVGRDVTDDVRLLNSRLCRRPLAQWPDEERHALLGDLS